MGRSRVGRRPQQPCGRVGVGARGCWDAAQEGDITWKASPYLSPAWSKGEREDMLAGWLAGREVFFSCEHPSRCSRSWILPGTDPSRSECLVVQLYRAGGGPLVVVLRASQLGAAPEPGVGAGRGADGNSELCPRSTSWDVVPRAVLESTHISGPLSVNLSR